MPAVPQTRKRAHEGVTWLPGYLTRTGTGRGTGAAAGRALFRAGRRGRHRPERPLAHGAVIRGGSLSPLPQASPALCCRVGGRGARRPGPPCVRALAVTAAPQAGRRRRGSVQRGGARNRVWSPKHSFSACVSPAASAAKAPGRGGLSPQWQAGLPARRRWSAGAGSQPLGAHGIAGLARPRRPACAVWCSSPAGGAGAGTRRAPAARRGRARAPATGRPRAPAGVSRVPFPPSPRAVPGAARTCARGSAGASRLPRSRVSSPSYRWQSESLSRLELCPDGSGARAPCFGASLLHPTRLGEARASRGSRGPRSVVERNQILGLSTT